MPHIHNLHSVALHAPPERAGALIDALGSPHDGLWPKQRWPAIRFEGPLAPGVRGAHGPVEYVIEAYEPGRRVRFRFLRPAGFVGSHTFEVRPNGSGSVMEHRVEMVTMGLAVLGWPLVFGPLHDALAEDAGANALAACDGVRTVRPWSRYVRLLRWIARWF